MLKIRRPLGRLIFNMGIAIPVKTVFLIETAPSRQWGWQSNLSIYSDSPCTNSASIYVITARMHVWLCILAHQTRVNTEWVIHTSIVCDCKFAILEILSFETCIRPCIRKPLPGKGCDEITYSFPNFNSAVEVWKWVSNLKPTPLVHMLNIRISRYFYIIVIEI